MYADDSVYLQRWIHHRDPEAFREIVGRYAAMVFATARRVLGNSDEAEDVSQECFQALAGARQAPSTYLGPWLHRVATNIALQKVRGTSRRQAREVKYAQEQPMSTHVTWNDIHAYVDEAIESLPEELRTPLVAHYLDGRSQTDIASCLGLPRQTVTNRIHKGVDEIRLRLQRKGIQVGGIALGTMFVSAAAEAASAPASLLAGLGKVAISGVSSSAITPVVTSSTMWSPVASMFSTGLAKSAALSTAAVLAVASGAIVVANRGAAPQEVQAAVAEPERFGAAIKEPTTADEVLDLYRDYQKHIGRLTVTYDMKGNFSRVLPLNDPYYNTGNGSAEVYQRGEISTDGHRVFTSTSTWGTNGMTFEPVSSAAPNLRICSFDGTQDYQWDGTYKSGGMGSFGQGGAPLNETLSGAPSNGTYYALWGMVFDAAAWGYLNFEGRRIDDILREASTKAFNIEHVGELQYYEVSGETPYGTFTARFDPLHGFNVVQMHMQQREGHLQRKGDTRPLRATFVRDVAYTVMEFAEVDGLWVPKEYTRTVNETQPSFGKSYNWNSHFTRTSIQLNPDFDALKTFAFMRDVPDGAEFSYRTFAGDKNVPRYIWRNGAMVQK